MTEDDRERIRRLLNSEDQTRNDVTPHHADGRRPRVYEGPLTRPRLDADNMPLPRRVDQVDMGGTRVTPAAYQTPSQPTRYSSTQRKSPPSQPPFDKRRDLSCAAYGLVGLLFEAVVNVLIVTSIQACHY